MSLRKIIFLAILSLVGLILLYLLWNLSQAQKSNKAIAVDSLSVWLVGDTTEQYEDTFFKFAEYKKQYKNTKIEIRIFPDYEKYQRILLSTLAEGTGPDIFMVEARGDDILEGKIEPIPDSILDLSDFERKYEDIFLPLLQTEGKDENMVKYIKGIPLGYETLGVFYHKSLFLNFPRTWAELSIINDEENTRPIFTSNLGLGPTYSKDATDIIAYFLGKNGVRETEFLPNGRDGLEEFLAYGDTSLSFSSNDNEENGQIMNLRERIEERISNSREKSALTSVDLFMRGDIAMLIGFPSLIREIEKAEKRAGEELYKSVIYTEKLPRDTLSKQKTNIARYRYLAISKKTTKPLAAADLLGYIMSDVGRQKVRENFPLLLSPIRGERDISKNASLSTVFARTKMDAFIPELEEEVFVFDYNLKSEYEKIFREYIDRNEIRDINKLIKTLQKNITCEVASLGGGKIDEECLQEE